MKTQIRPLIIAVGFVYLTAAGPNADAVIPPPDGGYPGGNTAEGQNALFSLTTGGFNTATGWLSLKSTTTGSFNTSVGAGALASNTGDSNSNTATGAGALFSMSQGGGNTANGAFALFNNTFGVSNTAVGYNALSNNTTSSVNTAIGASALSRVTTGGTNIGIGAVAGFNVTTASNVICIGSSGANVSGTCYIGHIRGVQTQNGDAIGVVIDSTGQLGTMSSSRRFKEKIKPMDRASEAIFALRPVTFEYKSDEKNTPQFGLIAEEVAKINPCLVVREENGEIYTVRYEAVNAMLLNEFLKAHCKMEEQQKQIDALTVQLEQQAAQIQKVSAQMEMNRSAPQMAANEP